MNLHQVTADPFSAERTGPASDFALHLLMTSHTGLRVWQIRVRGDVDKAVAVTAVHSELRYVNIVRERDGWIGS